MTKTPSLTERLITDLTIADWHGRAPASVVEWVARTQVSMQLECSPDQLARWSGWDPVACATMLKSVGVEPNIPDSPGGRIFYRWLEMSAAHRGWETSKRTWTQTEQRLIGACLKVANEEALLAMLEWAFHGTDRYATFLQGKTSYDESTPTPHLGLATLFKEDKLDRRLDLGRAHVEDQAKHLPPKDHQRWLEEEAFPALSAMANNPDDWEAAYEWWAGKRGRHPGGASADLTYIEALLKLRDWKPGHAQ